YRSRKPVLRRPVEPKQYTSADFADACARLANRHGRMQIIEHEELKYLLKKHLGLDVLISLPKPPPRGHK
ncbi:hypothetical protein, partial [Actinomadura sp. LOL_011]|uniref:hypothetical protein n=1 Tax=Actinomadura sp. LOL_011 TaxID=3345410 RepID=UPI003A812105